MTEETREQRFAKRIAEAARIAGYDIDSPQGGGRKALAEATGMSQSSVGRMLAGQTMPNATALEPLAVAVGVPVMSLLVLAGIVSSSSEGRTTEAQLRAELWMARRHAHETDARAAEAEAQLRAERAELRMAQRHAHETDARAAEAEANLLDQQAATLRADARAARAHASIATKTAALHHLRQVWRRWFENSQTGVTLREFVEGVGADLKAVLDEADADGPAGPGDDAWGTVWLHGNWQWLTKNMPTAEREHAADAVARWSRRLAELDGEPERGEPEGLRWWREA